MRWVKKGLVAVVLLSLVGSAVFAQADQRVKLRWRTRPSNIDEQNVYQAISDGIAAKYPNINLVFDPAPVQGYEEKLMTEYSSGTAPDIVWVPGATYSTYAKRNLLLDLMPMMAKDPSTKVEDFYPVVMKEMIHEGKLFGLPRDISTLVVYYNEDFFRKKGLKTPLELEAEGKWNWETFYQSALALTNKSGSAEQITYGVSMTYWWPNYLSMVMQAGGSLFNKERTASGLNNQGTIDAFTFMKKMYNGDGKNPPVAPAVGGSVDGPSMFLSGKIGMHFDGRWSTPAIRAMAKFKWNAVTLPTGPKGKANFVFWGAYVISRNTKNKDAAYQVLKELTSIETQIRLAKMGTNIPSRISKEAREAFLKSTPPENSKAFLDAIEYSLPEQSPWNINMNLVLGQYLRPEAVRVVNGEISPQEFVNSISETINGLFEK